MNSVIQISTGIMLISFFSGFVFGSILTAIALYCVRTYFAKNKIKSKKHLLKG